jgi:hypothetical protein
VKAKGGRPSKWKHTRTVAIRVPEFVAPLLMELAKCGDEEGYEIGVMREVLYIKDGVLYKTRQLIENANGYFVQNLPQKEKRKRTARAETEVPESFAVTDEMKEWAVANAPGFDLDRETGKFLDRHRARGSKFKDWTAAWRTWMRQAVEFRERDNNGRIQTPPSTKYAHRRTG